jgi:hypothetical protein
MLDETIGQVEARAQNFESDSAIAARADEIV